MPINATTINIPSSRSRSSPNSFSSSGTTETDEKIRKSCREMMVGGEVVEATSPIGSASVRSRSRSRSRSTRRFMDALSVGESILNNFRSRGMKIMNNNDLPQAPPPPPQHNHNVNPNSDLLFFFTAGDNSRSNNNNDENDSNRRKAEAGDGGANNNKKKVMMVKKAKVYDGRMHSLPHKKHGPYTCPRCLEVFITSQSYAAHISNSHYRRDETNAQKINRLMARRTILRNTTLCPQRDVNNNLITFVPIPIPISVSSSSSFAATRSAPPAPSAPPNYYGRVVVKVEEEEDRDDDDDNRPRRLRRQVPPATATAPAPTASSSSSMVVEDEDLNGVPSPPPGFEAHHVRRLPPRGAKATKLIIKSEEDEDRA